MFYRLTIIILLCYSCSSSSSLTNEQIKQRTLEANNRLIENPITLLDNSNYPQGIRQFYELGQKAYYKKNYISATRYYQKAYQYFNSSTSLNAKVSITQQYALSLAKVKAYEQSLKILIEAIALEKQQYLPSKLPYLYYNQGLIYTFLNQQEKAKKSWQQSLFFAEDFQDNRYIILSSKRLESSTK